MSTILVVNAGSSSVKFQVFALEGGGKLARKIKGQMDGIGTRRDCGRAGPRGRAFSSANMTPRPFSMCLRHCTRGAHGASRSL